MYCERTDIEKVFGSNNVETWADINNNHDETEIAERIDWAIGVAVNEINDKLRGGPYAIPFGSPPETIRLITAQLAGVWLYEARGIEEIDTETGNPIHRLQWHRTNVERIIREIRAGQRKLDVPESPRSSSVPVVVGED